MTTIAYNLETAAAACGVSTETIRRAIKTGALQAKRSGKPRDDDGKATGRYVIPAASLEAWVEGLEAA